MDFDLAAGTVLKESGMEAASNARRKLLKVAQEIARATAAGRETKLISIDDVYRVLKSKGYDTSKLGNAAGSVFKRSCWEFVGWRQSERVSNKARSVRIWKFNAN